MSKFLRFRVSGDGLDFDCLAAAFTGRELCVHKKGEVFHDRYAKAQTVHTEDTFSFDKEYHDAMPVDDAVLDFLAALEPHSSFICELAQKHTVMLWISLYPDDSHVNVRLSAKTLSRLKQFGLEVDIELTYLKAIYEA